VLPDLTRDAAELRELAHVQRELQRLIAPRASADADVESEARVAAAARAIGCAAEQIAVYRRMGAQRFANEVAREFPATRALLGDARFCREARQFVTATASTSYTLDGYARAFPVHLQRAARAQADEELACAAGLARLERECARAARVQRGASEQRRELASARSSEAPRLTPARGARLLRLPSDALALLDAFERGEVLPLVKRAPTYVAVFPRGRRAVRLRVARAEAPALAALLRGDALEAAVSRALAAGLAPADVGSALQGWAAAGLIALVRA
jgi:hypothetical protein